MKLDIDKIDEAVVHLRLPEYRNASHNLSHRGWCAQFLGAPPPESLFPYSDSSHSIKPVSRFQRGRREDGGSIVSSAARFASRFACA